MAIKRLILIRPGETDWNQSSLQQGWVAIPLNTHGKRQVGRLAKFVRNIGMGALYSSDLRRARETADILAKQLSFQPIFDPRLRERNVGEWQGLALEEIREWYPDAYSQLLDKRQTFQIPSGESRQQVELRACAVFEDILARGGTETVGIISHTITMRILISELVSAFDTENLELANVSVTTLSRIAEDKWKLVECNDVSHLEGMKTDTAEEPDDTGDR